MATIINEDLNDLHNKLNNVINNQPKLNEYNLSIRDLNNNLNNSITKSEIKLTIKTLITIYEQSTRASTTTETTEETAPTNPTDELITFLINRNREDSERFKLTHFKNIRCNDANNRSCIIPIYKAPKDRHELNEAELSNILIHTINYTYFRFRRDMYNITYKNIMERMDPRYKNNVGLFKE